MRREGGLLLGWSLLDALYFKLYYTSPLRSALFPSPPPSPDKFTFRFQSI